MRNVFWRIFFLFWALTIVVVIASSWFTGEFAREASLLARANQLTNDNAHAAVSVLVTGGPKAVERWFYQLKRNRNILAYLYSEQGRLIAPIRAPKPLKSFALALKKKDIPQDNFIYKSYWVSRPVVGLRHQKYRLLVRDNVPFESHFSYSNLNLLVKIFMVIGVVGIICFLLSRYLTRPIVILQAAARAVGQGQLSTRVVPLIGHRGDEIAKLAEDFDQMVVQIERLMKSSYRLVQDVSHELRSPIARLQVALEIARKKTDGRFDVEFDRIIEESQRLNDLIGKVLSLASLESAQYKMGISEFDLADLLHKIVDNFIYEKQLEANVIALHLPKDAVVMMADQDLLHSAFENIMRNALTYANAKAPRVDVAVTCPQANTIVVTIADNGRGLPAALHRHIFEPFYRHPSHNESQKGYGLGLAIVKRVIDLHHATIRVKQNPKHSGLTLEVTLKRVPDQVG